jgi:hypothetical protein
VPKWYKNLWRVFFPLIINHHKNSKNFSFLLLKEKNEKMNIVKQMLKWWTYYYIHQYMQCKVHINVRQTQR